MVAGLKSAPDQRTFVWCSESFSRFSSSEVNWLSSQTRSVKMITIVVAAITKVIVSSLSGSVQGPGSLDSFGLQEAVIFIVSASLLMIEL